MAERNEEFNYAKSLLQAAMSKDPGLDSFKIRKGEHSGSLDHSFICQKNNRGEFEIFRMSGDILGKGTEGKVKIIENEAEEQFVVKISAAPTVAQAQKAASELEMMNDVGLLLGTFVRQRGVKKDKVLNKDIGDKQYTLQKYVPGKELANLLKVRNLDEMEKLKILREILACADFVHSKSIIHRDIKPENMIITFDENDVIQDCTFIDYGCSLKVGDSGTVIKPYAGSPSYMAPEIGRNEFYKEYGAYNKLAAELRKFEASDPTNPRIETIKQEMVEQKAKFLAVLGKEYSFTPKVDMYAIGVLAANVLKLNLDDLGLKDLQANDPQMRPSAKEAMKKVQHQINAMMATELSDTFDDRQEAAKSRARKDSAANKENISPKSNIRKPAMVRMKDLHNIEGKEIVATTSELAKLKQFQQRGLTGIFEIQQKEFLIDDKGKAYGIYRPLGKGGLGSVYLVQDLETEKWYAAKTSGNKLGRRDASPEVIKVMQRENRMLEELGQLVGVVSAFRGKISDKMEEHAVSIQEFAYGEEYFDINKENAQIPGDQAVLMSLRLFEELAFLHDRKILHLDIKPENMKWDSDLNRCKILDMGCSVKVPGDVLEHKAFHYIGTVEYHPPEIKSMEDNIYSDKSDVYAAGKSIKSIIEKATNLNPEEITLLNRFIQRTQSENPKDRPTAEESKEILFQLAQKMYNEKRLIDVNVAFQTAVIDLNQYISQKLSAQKEHQEAVQKGLVTWMKSIDHITAEQKIEIAKSVVDKIQSEYAHATPSNLTEQQILEMAESIIQARIENIEKSDPQMEEILQKSCDGLSTSLTQHLDLGQRTQLKQDAPRRM